MEDQEVPGKTSGLPVAHAVASCRPSCWCRGEIPPHYPAARFPRCPIFLPPPAPRFCALALCPRQSDSGICHHRKARPSLTAAAPVTPGRKRGFSWAAGRARGRARRERARRDQTAALIGRGRDVLRTEDAPSGALAQARKVVREAVQPDIDGQLDGLSVDDKLDGGCDDKCQGSGLG